jgi:hypothetical protein
MSLDFGAPKPSEISDTGKLLKLAQRVEKALREQVLFKEPKQLDPQSVLVSPKNRDGAPPNIQYIHFGLLKNFITKGFDTTRPMVGICVQYTSPEGKAMLIEHNKRFSSSLLPPVDEDKAMYGSLAGSHLNIALRLLQRGCNSPAGDVRTLCDSDPSLKDAATHGHRWWILPESLATEIQVDISLWRNADQNENQGTHEIEILGTIMATAELLKKTQKKVILGDLVAKAGKRSPAKIMPLVLNTLAKFFVQFLETDDMHLLKEIVDFHSVKVNPRELVVSGSFFQTLVGEEPLSKAPLLRMHILLTQYTNEKCKAQVGGPAHAQFLEPSSIQVLGKKAELVQQVEKKILELRGQLLPLLEKTLQPQEARLEFAELINLVVRCLLAKPWPAEYQGALKRVGTGRYSEEKVQVLAKVWAKQMDLKFADLNIATASGFVDPESQDPEEADQMEVDLGKLKGLKRNSSDASDSKGPSKTFRRGDEVTVLRRMTWHMPLPGTPDYRKDIIEGTSGIVEGFSDLQQNLVLLKVVVDLPKAKAKEVIQQVHPKNLQLTSEYEAEKVVAAAPAPEKTVAGAKAKSKALPDWLLGDSEKDAVRTEANWHKLLANNEAHNRTFWLKSRVGVCLEALAGVVPEYTDKDLLVCHRMTPSGVWKDELWTLRSFAPYELAFAPLVSQLKDTHLTLAANAVLGVPKHGHGAHPEQQVLALDGRMNNMLAKQGSIDDTKHMGILYFLVQRSQNPEDANMSIENLSWEYKVTLTMPTKKPKKSIVQWDAQDLPTIPILVNKERIEEHTRLILHQQLPKKDEKQGEK